MKSPILWLTALVALCASAPPAQNKVESPAPATQFVTVDKDVKLEILDWGGTGRPLIFLAGGGRTAHDYDQFAPKFTTKYHAYGITRRGFGASSKPAPTVANYAADRLGDDVLAVMDALKLTRPILIGHSMAGEELSSIGSRHPEKVAGLIYLDAGYPWAYYDHAHGDTWLDMLDLKKRIDALRSGAVYDRQFVQGLSVSVSQLEKDLPADAKRLASMPIAPPPPPPISLAMLFGEQKYTEIHVPILAIFAVPHNFDGVFRDNPAVKAAMVAADLARTSLLANDFEAGLPSAHVVRLPNADHAVFISNEAEVFREMTRFMASLH
ncbi:MAG TPA: alpha/beta hydrolase [Acidobacteriaceae bacterium]